MEESSPLEKKFQQLLQENDFSIPEEFRNDSRWEAMTSKEKLLLATLFVVQGGTKLQIGDQQAIESFDMALKIAPNNPIILFRVGAAYASQSQNLRCLTAACQAFAAAVESEPNYCVAWISWGDALIDVARLQGEAAPLYEAHEKFLQAHDLIDQLAPLKQAHFYWSWGLSWYLAGQLSGEANEYNCALENYHQAADCGIEHPSFWTDYGNAISEFAILVGRGELLLEAIELYRTAIKTSPGYFAGWFQLACTCQKIFEITKDEVYYNFAVECFERSAEIEPDNAKVHLNMSLLLIEYGKLKQSEDSYKAACEKLASLEIHEDNLQILLSKWAEAQMLWGAQSERIDLLREAETKIIKSLKINAQDADSWSIYGHCLNELGRYFEDEQYYVQAIEKFEYGLKIAPKHANLLYGIALAHFAIGDLTDDLACSEKAATYCQKVYEVGGAFPQFWNDWGVALMHMAEQTSDQNLIESAIEKYEMAVGKNEEEWGKRTASYELGWLYNYGCAWDFLGGFTENAEHYERAIHLLKLVLQNNPQHHHARYNLALAYSHLGDLTDDIESYHHALEQFAVLSPEDVEDDIVWHDWSITLMNLAMALQDVRSNEEIDDLYIQAEEKLYHALALGNLQANYSLACLYSLMGKLDMTMHYLERADLAGTLPSIEDLLHDDWLEAVRETTEFSNFIAFLSNKYQNEKQ